MNTAIYNEKEMSNLGLGGSLSGMIQKAQSAKTEISEMAPVFHEVANGVNAAVTAAVQGGITTMNSMMLQWNMGIECGRQWARDGKSNQAGSSNIVYILISIMVVGIILYVGPIVMGNLEPTMQASVPETSAMYNATVKTSQNIGTSYELGSIMPILMIAAGFIGLVMEQFGVGFK